MFETVVTTPPLSELGTNKSVRPDSGFESSHSQCHSLENQHFGCSLLACKRQGTFSRTQRLALPVQVRNQGLKD
jgi:hypothetical protein